MIENTRGRINRLTAITESKWGEKDIYTNVAYKFRAANRIS